MKREGGVGVQLTIGQVASAAHVNVETIRYYERRGLMPPPERSRSGYRQYEPAAVRRLRFVKRAQALGFTLAEIGELLDLRADPVRSCEQVEAEASRAIARIDRQIEELERMREALAPLRRACHERPPGEECPILDALEAS